MKSSCDADPDASFLIVTPSRGVSPRRPFSTRASAVSYSDKTSKRRRGRAQRLVIRLRQSVPVTRRRFDVVQTRLPTCLHFDSTLMAHADRTRLVHAHLNRC
jgi:hypothetical protein